MCAAWQRGMQAGRKARQAAAVGRRGSSVRAAKVRVCGACAAVVRMCSAGCVRGQVNGARVRNHPIRHRTIFQESSEQISRTHRAMVCQGRSPGTRCCRLIQRRPLNVSVAGPFSQENTSEAPMPETFQTQGTPVSWLPTSWRQFSIFHR